MKIEDLRERKTSAERLQNTTRIAAIVTAFVSVFVFFVKILFL
ncbi:hypothetical protein SAMN05661099_2947 [Daejeonella lutea]|uniref:Uncharacterized protein n=1 Tax=Daejeonella lutea TaxID=572036 RepID=A0A1T5EEY1_9SPHI|nr:hypothetical protein SAMN05661099_2947 [Daejeonella lutea]